LPFGNLQKYCTVQYVYKMKDSVYSVGCFSDDLELPGQPVESDLPPYFKQKSNDPNIFSEDHGGIKVGQYSVASLDPL
jgi:hypothetical protein